MQVTVETKQAVLLFVMVPTDASEYQFSYTEPIEFRIKTEANEYPTILLPERFNGSSLEILGSPFSLTEEQWAKIVDYSDIAAMGVDDHQGGYKCYERNHWFHSTATEAGKSLLVANKIYQTNTHPFASTVDRCFYDDEGAFYQELYSGALSQWEEAQSHTGNWVVIVKYKNSQ